MSEGLEEIGCPSSGGNGITFIHPLYHIKEHSPSVSPEVASCR